MSAMSDGEAITAEGLEALKAELAHLEGEARRDMARRIMAARELGAAGATWWLQGFGERPRLADVRDAAAAGPPQ